MTFRSAGGLTTLALGLFALSAEAQPCCGGSTVVSPVRLAPYESALVGLQARGTSGQGSFDRLGRFAAAPSGTGELTFTQEVLGAVRWLENGEASLLVPLVETYRWAGPMQELGVGLGDLVAAGRYELRLLEESIDLRVGLVASALIPTGNPPERSTRPLATDATGIGTWRLGGAVELERWFGNLLLHCTAAASQRLERQVQDLREGSAPELTGVLALGYAFRRAASVGLAVSHTRSSGSFIDGAAVPGTARQLTSVSALGNLPWWEGFRPRASVSLTPPIPGLGRNQPATVSAQIAVLRVW